MDTFNVDDHAVADLANASAHFRQMPYPDRQALTEHATKTLLLAGVLRELDGREIFDAVLTAGAPVKRVAESVEAHVKTVADGFLRNVDSLKSSYPNLKLNSSELGSRVIEIQERANDELVSRIGESFRSRLGGRFETRALKAYVRGQEAMPGRYTQTLRNTEKWLGRLKNVGTVMVAVDFGGAVYDCVKDIRDGADNLETCAKSLGGFVGGTFVGSVGGAIIGALILGGAPLIGATILVTGLGIGASYLVKERAGQLYRAIN